MTTRGATLAVFPGGAFSGWLLYFSGVKRATIISKTKSSGLSVQRHVAQALIHLLPDDEGPMSLLVIHGWTGKRIRNHEAELPEFLNEITDPVLGDRLEIVQYLFDSAKAFVPPLPTKPKKSLIHVPQSEGDDGEGESVGPGTIVVCSDASIRSISKTHKSLRVGTGWVIGYHDEGERVLVGHRTYPTMARHQTDLMEMHGVHDALLHLASAEEIHKGVKRAALYCDNVGVVRALLDGFASKNLNETIPLIMNIVDSLPFDVEFFWARGHYQNRWNLMADKMASLGSSKNYESQSDLAESIN